MVYYGAVSKGCEGCRKRKVKCDEHRPQCLKCIKIGMVCPGYRDLNDVVFRDESQRIIKNAQRFDGSQPADLESRLQQVKIHSPPEWTQSSPSDSRQPPKLLLTPQQPVEEVGASFFFTKYGFDLPPFYKGYDTWLSQTYYGGNSILGPVIESVGMAGLANTTNTPDMMTRAHRRYQEGITRVNEALNDPFEGLTDEAFMSVILLAFFETVSFQDWGRYRNWLDHIKAATALLELRGQSQFSRQRGAQLFIQIRSQILLACVQQRLTVPPAVVQATYYFETGSLRDKLKSKYVASPGSISEISLRIVNLRAAAKNKNKSSEEYRSAARAIDADLIMWSDVAPKQWNYSEVDGPEGEGHYRGKKHVYKMPWSVEIWNNWRVLRIAASQIMIQDVPASSLETETDKKSLQLIREMSEDICISVSAFSDYPRILSLIRPLYIVATEPRNEYEVRTFAIKHLRRLGLEMGVRQPVLLADRIQQYMAEEQGVGGMSAMECDTFMLSGPY